MKEDFDIKTAKVKICPLRLKCRESVKHYGGETFYRCQWPEGHMCRSHYEQDMTCIKKPNEMIDSCRYYDEWSQKQVRDAFKKLEDLEVLRDAVLGVLRM